jgi:hypothetical protein
MRIVSLFLTLVMATSTALTQQSVPPPPQPALDKPATSDNSPSLEVTMKFIQAKLNEIGQVNYTVTFLDAGGNFTGSSLMSVEKSHIVADAGKCQISYHAWVQVDRKKNQQSHSDEIILLRDVRNISVMKASQWIHEYGAGSSMPTGSIAVSPEMYFLIVRQIKSKEDRFAFDDEEMANRVAKALLHAVELCGVGGQPEPF